MAATGITPTETVTFEEANRAFDLLAAAQAAAVLRKIGAHEWSGPCVFCGGTDRFSVNTAKAPNGAWLCRKCTDGVWRDAVEYVSRRDDVELPEAARRMVDAGYVPAPRARRQPVRAPVQEQTDEWRAAAEEYAAECHARLFSDEGQMAREYLRGRGLDDISLYRWRLGFDPAWCHPAHVPATRAIVIPCWAGDKLRYVKGRRGDSDPKYVMLPGSQGFLFGADTFTDNLDGFLFEGEFDAMLAQQEWQQSGGSEFTGFGSFPANQDIPAAWIPFLIAAERILICHDMDEAGRASCAKLAAQSNKIRVTELPMGNDLTEYRSMGGDVVDWFKKAMGGGPWPT